MRRALRHGLLVLAPLLVAAPVSAQTAQPQEAAQQQAKSDSTPQLVYEREVFDYPTYQRRNPFHPLVGADQGGPRFEQLRLMGIVYDGDEPGESVATVGTSTVSVSQDGTTVTVSPGQSWYLKAGQAVGNIRVVAIHEHDVVVDVEEFGMVTRKIMQIQTRRGGGTP